MTNILLTGLSIFTTWIFEINLIHKSKSHLQKHRQYPLQNQKKNMNPLLIV